MPLQVERGPLDLDRSRFEYTVSFRPGVEAGEIDASIPVQVAISVAESGDLADLTFELPKILRYPQATSLIAPLAEVRMVNSRVFLAVPGVSGDTVLPSSADLELDANGRIVRVRVYPY